MWTYNEFLLNCAQLAAQAFEAYCANQCSSRLYLVGTMENGRWQTMGIAGESPDLDRERYVTSEPIPWHYTQDMLTRWFRELLKREPVLRVD